MPVQEVRAYLMGLRNLENEERIGAGRLNSSRKGVDFQRERVIYLPVATQLGNRKQVRTMREVRLEKEEYRRRCR